MYVCFLVGYVQISPFDHEYKMLYINLLLYNYTYMYIEIVKTHKNYGSKIHKLRHPAFSQSSSTVYPNNYGSAKYKVVPPSGVRCDKLV